MVVYSHGAGKEKGLVCLPMAQVRAMWTLKEGLSALGALFSVEPTAKATTAATREVETQGRACAGDRG